jgi:hypothetical protein
MLCALKQSTAIQALVTLLKIEHDLISASTRANRCNRFEGTVEKLRFSGLV